MGKVPGKLSLYEQALNAKQQGTLDNCNNLRDLETFDIFFRYFAVFELLASIFASIQYKPQGSLGEGPYYDPCGCLIESGIPPYNLSIG